MLMFLAIPINHRMYLHNQYHLFQCIAEQVKLMQQGIVGNRAETIAIAVSIKIAILILIRVLIPKTKGEITISVVKTFVGLATSAQSPVLLGMMQSAILGNDASLTRHATRTLDLLTLHDEWNMAFQKVR